MAAPIPDRLYAIINGLEIDTLAPCQKTEAIKAEAMLTFGNAEACSAGEAALTNALTFYGKNFIEDLALQLGSSIDNGLTGTKVEPTDIQAWLPTITRHAPEQAEQFAHQLIGATTSEYNQEEFSSAQYAQDALHVNLKEEAADTGDIVARIVTMATSNADTVSALLDSSFMQRYGRPGTRLALECTYAKLASQAAPEDKTALYENITDEIRTALDDGLASRIAAPLCTIATEAPHVMEAFIDTLAEDMVEAVKRAIGWQGEYYEMLNVPPDPRQAYARYRAQQGDVPGACAIIERSRQYTEKTGAIETAEELFDLYIATGDERFLDPAQHYYQQALNSASSAEAATIHRYRQAFINFVASTHRGNYEEAARYQAIADSYFMQAKSYEQADICMHVARLCERYNMPEAGIRQAGQFLVCSEKAYTEGGVAELLDRSFTDYFTTRRVVGDVSDIALDILFKAKKP